jgi:hypothetical protein
MISAIVSPSLRSQMGFRRFTNNEWSVETSGLIGYRASLRKILHRMGYYVKKMLDGANPSDLPVE